MSVEVDEADDPAGGSPAPKQGRMLALATAGLVIVALIVAFFVLRPSEGESADGTERSAEVDADDAASESPPTDDVGDAADGAEAEAPAVAPSAPPITELVRSDDGFLGLVSSGGSPDLFRTTDGGEWVPVDVTVEGARGTGNWSNLISVDDGFALLRRRGLSAEGDLTERFVSPDGAAWTVDESFLPLENATNAFFPEFHLREAFGFVAFEADAVAAPLGVLFEEVLVESADVDPASICFIEEVNAEQFQVFACEADGETSTGIAIDITADDLVDPTAFTGVQQCAGFIGSLASTRSASMVVQRSDGAPAVQVEGSFSTFQADTPFGAIASVFVGDRLFEGSSACDDFPGSVPEFQPVEIEFADLDGSVTRFALPDEVPQPPQIPGSPFTTETELFIVLEQAIWRLDLQTEAWELVVDIPSDLLRPGRFQFVSGEQAVGIGQDSLILVDLVAGEIEEVAADIGSFPQLLHADEQVVIARDELEPGRIDLIDLP